MFEENEGVFKDEIFWKVYFTVCGGNLRFWCYGYWGWFKAHRIVAEQGLELIQFKGKLAIIGCV